MEAVVTVARVEQVALVVEPVAVAAVDQLYRELICWLQVKLSIRRPGWLQSSWVYYSLSYSSTLYDLASVGSASF